METLFLVERSFDRLGENMVYMRCVDHCNGGKGKSISRLHHRIQRFVLQTRLLIFRTICDELLL
jgi:hypothetical protein